MGWQYWLVLILERIKRQADLVDELVKELEVEKSYRGIERLVQLVIQALLDLGLMIIAALGYRRPRTYSEIGYILRELEMVSEDEAETLRSMAGLRNILVHVYANIDRNKILEYAESLKVDVARIKSNLLRGIENKPLDPPSGEIGELVEKLRSVLKGRVKLAFLYGGRTMGYSLKGDYDIAVLIEHGCDLYRLGELVVDIAKTLGVPEENIDIVCLDALPPEHLLEALGGVAIVSNSALLFELRYRAMLQLLDLEENSRLLA